MIYRRLGKSDLNISEIAIGCMSLKGGFKENEVILNRAINAGINLFDTSDLYEKGENETEVGRILKPHRKHIFIATKAGNQWRQDGSGWDWNPGKEYILNAVEGSLKRLQTDYIDLYQLHGGTINDPIDETIEAFELLKKQGKIRYYGISSIRPNVIREYVKRSNIVSVMMQYSLLDRRPEESCFSLLKENNIGVLARGSLAQGLLIDKPPREYLNRSAEEVEKAALAVQKISRNRAVTSTALQFVLRNESVTSAVTGVRTVGQLDDLLRTFNDEAITTEDIEFLKQSTIPNFYTEHC